MIGFSVHFPLDPLAPMPHPVMAPSPADHGTAMTHPPQQQPPTVHGYPAQPPRGDWAPTPRPPAKRGPLPWLIAALVVAVLGMGGLIAWVAGESGKPAKPAASPPPPALTQAGAERACRTAFGEDWKGRSAYAEEGSEGVIMSLQRIELLETWKTDTGFSVNATVHYTMTASLIAEVKDTIDLTCTAAGTDEAPITDVNKRS